MGSRDKLITAMGKASQLRGFQKTDEECDALLEEVIGILTGPDAEPASRKPRTRKPRAGTDRMVPQSVSSSDLTDEGEAG